MLFLLKMKCDSLITFLRGGDVRSPEVPETSQQTKGINPHGTLKQYFLLMQRTRKQKQNKEDSPTAQIFNLLNEQCTFLKTCCQGGGEEMAAE